MFQPPEEPVTLARTTGAYGEVVLRRRAGVEELVVDGAFAMDSAETGSERELGRLAAGAGRVLVGGLGLGYTVSAVLDEADRTRTPVQVDVVELEPALVGWARDRCTPTLARAATDPRVRLHVADVGHVLTGRPEGPAGPWGAILLDVDNGPDFLIHPDNHSLYAEPGLRRAYRRLAPGGLLAIWCQGAVPPLLATLNGISASARETLHEVRRGDRHLAYAIYTLRAPVGGTGAAAGGGPQ